MGCYFPILICAHGSNFNVQSARYYILVISKILTIRFYNFQITTHILGLYLYPRHIFGTKIIHYTGSMNVLLNCIQGLGPILGVNHGDVLGFLIATGEGRGRPLRKLRKKTARR